MDTTETLYGYARVSTQDQNLDRQIIALTEFGVEKTHIFTDKASGKDFNRPKYQRLKKVMRSGDVLVIKSIDRLGRNYNEILNEWRQLTTEKHIQVVVLDMPLLDTRTHISNGITGEFIVDIMLQLLSYIAQVERENIRSRQAEGIAAAKARGVKFGRPAVDRPAQFEEELEKWIQGEVSSRAAAAQLGVSHTTFLKWAHASAPCDQELLAAS